MLLAALCIAAVYTGLLWNTSAFAAEPRELKVALYPYVPRIDQFEKEIKAAWKKVEPGVKLTFVDWDSYVGEFNDNVDVFVFDAVLLDEFVKEGHLEPLADSEVGDIADFYSYALDGSRVNGRLYGVPQLGCANILYYRLGDQALESVQTLSDLVRILGPAGYTTVHPPTGVGLLGDICGGYSMCGLYLTEVEQLHGQYLPPPQASGPYDPGAVKDLSELVEIAGLAEAQYSDPGYTRAEWFSRGEGRAFMGFPESLASLGISGRSTVAFKLMPVSDSGGTTLFYADIIGVNAKMKNRANRALAVELARLMGSAPVMLTILGTTAGYDYPQYLLPVRPSVLRALSGQYPLYQKLDAILAGAKPQLLRMAPDAKKWVEDMKIHLCAQICPPAQGPASPNSPSTSP